MSYDLIKRTIEEENKAKSLCFADCSDGKHLDFEAGCCSVCKAERECQGWVAYLPEARAAIVAKVMEKE